MSSSSMVQENEQQQRTASGHLPDPPVARRSRSQDYGSLPSSKHASQAWTSQAGELSHSLELPTRLGGSPADDDFGEPLSHQLPPGALHVGAGLLGSEKASRFGRHFHGSSNFNNVLAAAATAGKMVKSGRQRKKIAARTRGGEFQARRRKRRLYFCCIGNEIDVEKLADHFLVEVKDSEKSSADRDSKKSAKSKFPNIRGRMFDEVLYLYSDVSDKQGAEHRQPENDVHSGTDTEREESSKAFVRSPFHARAAGADQLSMRKPFSPATAVSPAVDGGETEPASDSEFFHHHEIGLAMQHSDGEGDDRKDFQSTAQLWQLGGKELFVFDFGAIVFWGYQRDEVKDLLVEIRKFIVKGQLSEAEFEAGEDDMAFVTSDETDRIAIANDVILLPERTSVQMRLAVSFAIAQSSVLSIFEARIEEKIEEYKYIPEELALSGKVKMSQKELGNMIGEVFVIRHDVNLHSEILDIPDYFWKEQAIEPLYRLTMMYLEIGPRTEVVNKRLDLLRELLRLLQHQHENDHGVKLEWIVIWLILTSVILEVVVILSNVFGLDIE